MEQDIHSTELVDGTLFYLFELLKSSIDELYFMCDFQASTELCKKVEKILSTGKGDFESLRERLVRLENVQKEYQAQTELQEETEVQEDSALTIGDNALTWNISFRTPDKVKTLFKQKQFEKKKKKKKKKNKKKSSKKTKTSNKRWDDYTDESELCLDFGSTLPLAFQKLNQLTDEINAKQRNKSVPIEKNHSENISSKLYKSTSSPLSGPFSMDSFSTGPPNDFTLSSSSSLNSNMEIQSNRIKPIKSKSLLDLPAHHIPTQTYTNLSNLKLHVYETNSRRVENSTGTIFPTKGAPRPSDLRTPQSQLPSDPDSILFQIENFELDLPIQRDALKNEFNKSNDNGYWLPPDEIFVNKKIKNETITVELDVNNWSETVDAVLTGKDTKIKYPRWLQVFPEDEQNKIKYFFLKTARMYGELRENVKVDMKTRFGLLDDQVEMLYSIFLYGKEVHELKLEVMKKDPAHSLGLASGKAKTKFQAPHQKNAWLNARRVENFRSRQRRQAFIREERRQNLDEMKKDRDVKDNKNDDHTEAHRKWEARKEIILNKEIEEDANLAKKIQERHEKAKEARRARKEEIRDKVELFDFRKREIRLLRQLEEGIEVSKLHDKYNQRDQKADEALKRKMEQAGRRKRKFEERQAALEKLDKEERELKQEEIKKRHLKSQRRMLEQAAEKRQKNEAEMSQIEAVKERKKAKHIIASRQPSNNLPELFELSFDGLDEATGLSWSPGQKHERPRSKSLTRRLLKKHGKLHGRTRSLNSLGQEANLPEDKVVQLIEPVYEMNPDMVPIVNENEDESRLGQAQEILEELKLRSVEYAKTLPQPSQQKLGKGSSILKGQTNTFFIRVKKLLENIEIKQHKIRDDKSLETPSKTLLRTLADGQWIKQKITSGLLCDVMNFSCPLLLKIPNLSNRTVKYLGQIILLCVAFNEDVRRHVFCNYLHVFLEILPIFSFQYIHSHKKLHHPILPHITHTVTTLLRTNYALDDPEIIMCLKRDAFRYLCTSGYISQVVELFSKLMEITSDKLHNEWPIVFKMVSLVESLTRFDLNILKLPIYTKKPYLDDIYQTLRETNLAGMFSIFSWLSFGIPTALRHNELEALWQRPLSAVQLKIMMSALSVINNCGKFGLEIFLDVVSDIQVEIYHMLFYVLNYIRHHLPSQSKECGNLCREVFTFISMCTVQPEGALQEIFRWGKGQPLVLLLCDFPFNFILTEDGQRSLFPCLTCITYESEENTQLMLHTLNPSHVSDFIHKCLDKIPSEAFEDPSIVEKIPDENVLALNQVFPFYLWQEAINFYDAHSCCSYVYPDKNR